MSTEHTNNPSNKTSECEEFDEDVEYGVEIIGSADPPAEWQGMSQKKSSTSSSSASDDVDSSVERELVGNDSWRLTERDNDSLEVIVCR